MLQRRQHLDYDEDTGIIRLTNEVDFTELATANMEAQKTDGFTKLRTGRRLASVELDILQQDDDGKIYLAAPPQSPERKLALRRFLAKYPRYKTCSGNI